MYTQNELKAILAEKTNYHFSELEMDEFNNMLESQKYPSKIVGSTYLDGAQQIISQLKEGDVIDLVDETDNQYDSNAIACYYHNHKIGYIPKQQAPYFKDFYNRQTGQSLKCKEIKQKLSPLIDKGILYLTGKEHNPSILLNDFEIDRTKTKSLRF